MTHQVYLGLGSNLGNREEYIRKAIELIEERVGTVVRQSMLIETEPWGFQSKHHFLNGVILCETLLTPQEVLKTTQQIEKELGKRKKHATKRVKTSPLTTRHSFLTPHLYKDRPIDIDILLYDNLHIDEPNLKIPHPLMHERDFVMIPLNEIRNAEVEVKKENNNY